MKKVLLLFMPLALASACSSITSGVRIATSPTPIAANTHIDEKALATATNAYNFIARSYLTLNRKGEISPVIKAQVKPMIQNLYKGLKGLRAAKAVGDASGFSARLAAFYSLRDDIKSLGIGKE